MIETNLKRKALDAYFDNLKAYKLPKKYDAGQLFSDNDFIHDNTKSNNVIYIFKYLYGKESGKDVKTTGTKSKL